MKHNCKNIFLVSSCEFPHTLTYESLTPWDHLEIFIEMAKNLRELSFHHNGSKNYVIIHEIHPFPK